MQKQIVQTKVNGTQARTSPEEQMAAELARAIESLLFVSGRPLERAELRKLLDVDEAILGQSLQVLEDTLEQQRRGIRLQRLGEQKK